MKKVKLSKNILSLGLVLGVVLSMVWVSSIKSQGYYNNNQKWTQFYTKYKKQPYKRISLYGKIVKGTNKPVLTIVEFIDFLCPYCKIAGSKISSFAKKYKRQVKMAYVMYPLDKSCNKGLSRQIHGGACLAAYGAHCANQYGKFSQYHDNLFYRQEGYGGRFTQKNLDLILAVLGLKKGRFMSCVNSYATKKKVAQSIALGNKLGVTGTPTVFINGRKTPEVPDEFMLSRLLQEKLKR